MGFIVISQTITGLFFIKPHMSKYFFIICRIWMEPYNKKSGLTSIQHKGVNI